MSFSFWDIMSDAWLEFEDRDIFEEVWGAYGRAWINTRMKLWQSDISKSLSHIKVDTKYFWLDFTFDDTTLVSDKVYSTDDSSITSIPTLQDGINTYSNQYSEGTDYTVGDGTIVWTTGQVSTTLWAPTVYKNEYKISNNFGVLVQEELADSTAYLNAVSGMFYAYWNGPTIRNIRNGLNIFYGLPFAGADGIVFSVTDDSVIIKEGYNQYESYSLASDQTSDLVVGDSISKFDTIANTIEVFDYISKPRWWDTYSLDMINEDFPISSGTMDSATKKIINNYTKYFTFGIKIDAEEYADLTIVNPGIANRFITKIKPAYTHYKFIVHNDFRSIDSSDSAGDWLFLSDDYYGTATGLDESWTMDLTYTSSFNYISYIASISGYDSSNPITFDEYQDQAHESYDIDGDMIGLYDFLEIT